MSWSDSYDRQNEGCAVSDFLRLPRVLTTPDARKKDLESSAEDSLDEGRRQSVRVGVEVVHDHRRRREHDVAAVDVDLPVAEVQGLGVARVDEPAEAAEVAVVV